ncbi:UNVERIFIED_CONTAM: hypothetical protein RMT77_015279 [Armadillidium vulgare]
MAYRVKDNIKAYLDQPTLGKPKDWDVVMRTWYVDEWNHLIDPPSWLTSAHYALCLRNCDDNRVKKRKMTNAKSNLMMATMTHSSLSDLAVLDIAMSTEDSNSIMVSTSMSRTDFWTNNNLEESAGSIRKVCEPLSKILKDLKTYKSTRNCTEDYDVDVNAFVAILKEMTAISNNLTRKDTNEAESDNPKTMECSLIAEEAHTRDEMSCVEELEEIVDSISNLKPLKGWYNH